MTAAVNTASLAAAISADSAGALILTQGQLQFPATAVPSANANTLDDYEEGTWTPVPGNGSINFANASYIKIGKLVTVFFWVQDFSTVSSNQISGLPFVAKTSYFPSVVHTNANIVNVARVSSGSTNIFLLNFSDASVALNAFLGFAIATITYESAS